MFTSKLLRAHGKFAGSALWALLLPTLLGVVADQDLKKESGIRVAGDNSIKGVPKTSSGATE